jgi:hypothetical protein
MAHEPIDIMPNGRTDGIQSSMVLYLGSIPIRDIEHVDNLVSADGAQGLLYIVVQSGRNSCRMD